jgi:hypothetical protein
MFHLFQTYVASVYLDVAKVNLEVAYTYTLQTYVLSVFRCFICSMFASTSSGCCICLQWFLGVFISVSDACFKCFICLLLYVATVAAGCFESRSSVTYRISVGSG